MKIAFCISGQLRRFDNPKLLEKLKENVLKVLNPDIFVSVWKNRGSSLYSKVAGLPTHFENELVEESYVKSIYNSIQIDVEDYNDWFKNVNERLKLGFGQRGCSIAMIYKMFKCNQYKKDFEEKNNFKYDVVIRYRPDIIFYTPIPLMCFSNTEVVWNLNCFEFYNPNRIHDMLLISNSKNMDIICNIWNVFEKYWKDNRIQDCNLSNFDVTRALKLHCIDNGIKDKSFKDYSLFEIYREEYNLNDKRPKNETIDIIESEVQNGKVDLNYLQQKYSNDLIDWLVKNYYLISEKGELKWKN